MGWFFRTRGQLLALEAPIAKVLAVRGITKICNLYVDDAFGQAAVVQLPMLMKAYEPSADVVNVSTPNAPVTSRLAEVEKCTANGHNVMVVNTHGFGQADQVMKEAVENKLAKDFYYIEDQEDPQIFNALGWQNFNGTIGFLGALLPSPGTDLFDTEYKTLYGQAPDPALLLPYVYDAVVVVALAAAQAHSLDPTVIRDQMFNVSNAPGEQISVGTSEYKKAFDLIAKGAKINYQGISGIEFADNGEQLKQTGQMWHVNAATKSFAVDGYYRFDPAGDTFTWMPATGCVYCNPFGT
jgi:branched-chain amino acid transport system substrate-binding protein